MSGERICFVSGHMDLSKEEFAAHYEPRIREAHRLGARFVVGDARGCDFMAQRLLHELEAGQDRSTGRVRVYHMLERPRHSFGSGYGSRDPNLPKDSWEGRRGGFPLVGGFTSDEERDAAMTEASTEDIAWVRPGKQKRRSGTAANLERRALARGIARLRQRKEWPRFIVEKDWSDEGPCLRLHEPTPADPGVPIDPSVVDRLDRAHAAVDAAMAELRRSFEDVRRLVAEEESHPTAGGTQP